MTRWPARLALAAVMLFGSGALVIGCVLTATALMLLDGLRNEVGGRAGTSQRA